MFWKIWIWVSHDGAPHIGARRYGRRWREKAADYEQVVGNQIPHRVAALTPEGWRIMTPTKAKKMGYYAHRFNGYPF